MRLRLILSLCLPLLTTGCFIGDGVAHVVKLAAKSGDSSNDAAQPAPAPEAVNAPVDNDPAPQPAAAARDRIQVEQLPPKL
jgi:hypothetical protein